MVRRTRLAVPRDAQGRPRSRLAPHRRLDIGPTHQRPDHGRQQQRIRDLQRHLFEQLGWHRRAMQQQHFRRQRARQHYRKWNSNIGLPPAVSQSDVHYIASYFTTDTSAPAANQITGPGVYCTTVPATSCVDASSNGSNNNGAGSIFLNHAETGIVLVAPCVVLSKNAGSSTAPAGQPLIYGTGTGTSSSVYIDNNGNVLTGTIYVPNGTVELTANNRGREHQDRQQQLRNHRKRACTGVGRKFAGRLGWPSSAPRRIGSAQRTERTYVALDCEIAVGRVFGERPLDGGDPG